MEKVVDVMAEDGVGRRPGDEDVGSEGKARQDDTGGGGGREGGVG